MKKIYYITISALLFTFFLFAGIMTYASQREYEENLVEITTAPKSTGGHLDKAFHAYFPVYPYDNVYKLSWDLGSFSESVKVGTKFQMATDERSFTGTVTAVQREGEGYAFLVETDIPCLEAEDLQKGVSVTARLKSKYYDYIFPNDIFRGNTIAVVCSRPRVWGTEYYVHYEKVYVEDNNEYQSAISYLPLEGSVIVGAKGRLQEGTAVKLSQ